MLREQSPATLPSTDIPSEWQGSLPRKAKKITNFERSFKGIKLENAKYRHPRKQLERNKPQK